MTSPAAQIIARARPHRRIDGDRSLSDPDARTIQLQTLQEWTSAGRYEDLVHPQAAPVIRRKDLALVGHLDGVDPLAESDCDTLGLEHRPKSLGDVPVFLGQGSGPPFRRRSLVPLAVT